MLKSLLELKRHGHAHVSYVQEDMANGTYGSRSQSGYRFERDDIVRDGRFLETPDKRGNDCGFYSNSG